MTQPRRGGLKSPKLYGRHVSNDPERKRERGGSCNATVVSAASQAGGGLFGRVSKGSGKFMGKSIWVDGLSPMDGMGWVGIGNHP